jgi:PEP-CTERM motif-containing protein
MIRVRESFFAALFILSVNNTAFAQVLVPGLYGTGLNNSGGLLADGAVDPHYQLIASPSTVYPPGSPLFVVNSNNYPIPPWMANGPNSKWLSLQTIPIGVTSGNYIYRTTFDLTGYNPATARIDGNWTGDDDGIDIKINALSTLNSYSGPNQFMVFHPFTITNGFSPGLNTLDFIINNGLDRTGIRTELSLVAVPVPEPSTLVLCGIGFGLLVRPRKKLR